MNSQSAMRPLRSRIESSAENMASQRGSRSEDVARVGAVSHRAQRAHEIARRELVAQPGLGRSRGAPRSRAAPICGLERCFFGGPGMLMVVPSSSVSANIRGRPLRGTTTSFSSVVVISGPCIGAVARRRRLGPDLRLRSGAAARPAGDAAARLGDADAAEAEEAWRSDLGRRRRRAAGGTTAIAAGADGSAAPPRPGSRRGSRRGCRWGTRSSASPGASRPARPPRWPRRSWGRPSRRRASRPACARAARRWERGSTSRRSRAGRG